MPLTSTVFSPVIAPATGDVIAMLRLPVPVMSWVKPGDTIPPVNWLTGVKVGGSKLSVKIMSMPQNSCARSSCAEMTSDTMTAMAAVEFLKIERCTPDSPASDTNFSDSNGSLLYFDH